jgi:8-amino-7-oxononanoate synthase
MKRPHIDKRRLHERLPASLAATLSLGLNAADHRYSIKVFEASRDGLTCEVTPFHQFAKGSDAYVTFLSIPENEPIPVKIVHASNGSAEKRLGLQFNRPMDSLVGRLGLNASRNDRRKEERRKPGSEHDAKREFDRRGFWKGLQNKRVFSNAAWKLKNAGVYFYMQPLSSATEAHVIADGRDMIMMSSNNYLGLTTHPKVKEAAIEAIKKYGFAPGASSMLGGTLDIHLELEEELAKFKKVEAVVMFISGYVTNVTTLTTLLGRDDAVFNDELNHASLIDGSRLSNADMRAYRHCDMADLEKKLSSSKSAHKLVVTDSIFSMDGDIAPLPAVFKLCKKYGAAMMIDDAHGSGVFGPTGRGGLEHFDMEGKPEIIMGTLSKALGGIGGFIGGSKELIRILKNSARALVFSSYFPASICAGLLAALKVIDDEPERRIKLWHNAEHLRSGLQDMGFTLAPSHSPIIPVIFPTQEETFAMTKSIREQGIYASPVIFPAVKKTATRIRLTTMATHTEEDIEKVLVAFKKAKKSLRLEDSSDVG